MGIFFLQQYHLHFPQDGTQKFFQAPFTASGFSVSTGGDRLPLLARQGRDGKLPIFAVLSPFVSNCWIFKCHGVLEAAVIQLQNFEDTPTVDGENYIKESLGMYESL